MAAETFARQWGTQLTARLRQIAAGNSEGLTLRSYDEYVRSLPPTTAMILCTVEQTRQTAVVQMPVPTLMAWVDFLLGGTGVAAVDDPERELTEIEWTLVRTLLQHALADLTYAFASLLPLDLTIRSVQYNPQFVQAAAATDPVLVATLTLQLAERNDTATLMLPAEMILSALRESEAQVRSDDEERAHAAALADLDTAVHTVPVEVSVRMQPMTVLPREVLQLKIGDVIPLHHPRSAPLDVVVGTAVLAKAAVGTNGTRLACQVVTLEERPR